MTKFFWLGLVWSVTLFAYETPQGIKKKYESLYSSKIQQNADGSSSFHRGKLFKRNGIFVLSLHGDNFEMAFQHGKLLQSEIHQGALPETALMIEKAVKNAIPNVPVVTSAAASYYYKKYTDTILKSTLESFGNEADSIMLEAYGLSEGSGLTVDQVVRGVLGPESIQTVLGDRLKGKAVPSVGLANSCTDFVAMNQTTSSGEMIIGRSTDYPLNKYFDRFPTVLYYHPTDGSQKYLSVTSAGLHTAGVIGFNESGLFVGIHTIPTLDVSAKGNIAFLVGQAVMRKARNIDEAVAIFKKHKTAAGWTFTVASVRENRVVAVEINNKNVAVREEAKDWYVQSNHYRAPSMINANLELNASVTEDSLARLIRGEELIKRKIGSFTVADAVQILSDKWDPINKEMKSFGNVIANHMTVSSVVFEPARGRLFMANGTAPVSISTFVELPLITHFNEETFQSDSFENIESHSFTLDFNRLYQSEQKFIDAKDAFEIWNNPLKASEILNESVELDPNNAAYAFVQGILWLKAGRLDLAEKSLQANLTKKYKHYRLISQYYLGRIWASQGKGKQAQSAFQSVLAEADPVIERALIPAVKKNLSQVKRFGRVSLSPSTLVIFMPEGDMVEY